MIENTKQGSRIFNSDVGCELLQKKIDFMASAADPWSTAVVTPAVGLKFKWPLVILKLKAAAMKCKKNTRSLLKFVAFVVAKFLF